LQESIRQLWRLSETPEAPEENCLVNERHSQYRLSVSREQEIASNLAFLSAITNDNLRVMAVCVEERPDGKGSTIRIASNTGDLTALTSGIRKLANVLERAARRENNCAEDQRDFFQQVVSLDMPRIPSRLRSRHAKSSRKTAGKPAVIKQLGEILHHGSVRVQPGLMQPNRSALRCQAKALEALFVRLEGISDKPTNADEIRKVLEEIIRKAHDVPASDLNIALRDVPENPSLKNHLPNAIGKLGRYLSVSCELVCAVRDRKYGIFHNIQVEPYKINVPAPIRDAGYKVHAEIQLLFFYEAHPNLPRLRIICSSKSACYLCNLFFRLHNSFQVPRTHGRLYDKWTLPDWLDIPSERRSSLGAIATNLRAEIDSQFRVISQAEKLPRSHPDESILLPPVHYPFSSALSSGVHFLAGSRLAQVVSTAPNLLSRLRYASGTNNELVNLIASKGAEPALNSVSQVSIGDDNLLYRQAVIAALYLLYIQLDNLSLAIDFVIGASGHLLVI
ncbi:hypothetical protein OIDMADRAFT_132009, partial [Oidiodendron maius Zn]